MAGEKTNRLLFYMMLMWMRLLPQTSLLPFPLCSRFVFNTLKHFNNLLYIHHLQNDGYFEYRECTKDILTPRDGF